MFAHEKNTCCTLLIYTAGVNTTNNATDDTIANPDKTPPPSLPFLLEVVVGGPPPFICDIMRLKHLLLLNVTKMLHKNVDATHIHE